MCHGDTKYEGSLQHMIARALLAINNRSKGFISMPGISLCKMSIQKVHPILTVIYR